LSILRGVFKEDIFVFMEDMSIQWFMQQRKYRKTKERT